MRRKTTLLLLAGLLFVLLAVYGIRLAVLSGRHGIYVETERAATQEELMTPGAFGFGGDTVLKTPVNINTAEALELELLPGVGAGLAAEIVSFREANGPFSSTEELLQVKGIGETLYARISPYITV